MDAHTIAGEIEDALGRAGLVARALVPISSRDRRRRVAFRAELEDGSRVKLRVVESEDVAGRIETLRAHLESGFAPVIVRHRRVLVEAWIEGDPVDADDPGRVAAAGALLGGLHAAFGVGSEPAAVLIGDLKRQLDVLAEARTISRSGAGRLAARLEAQAPGKVALTRLHVDFLPENMVVDGDGALRVIDNEWMRTGPAGLDVGLVLARWPMTEALRTTFLTAYRESGAPTVESLPFWRLASGIWRSAWRPPSPADEALISAWQREAGIPIVGWDLEARFAGRRTVTQPGWSYAALVAEAAQGKARLLDVGTGGGELLERLLPSLPSAVVATEGFAPNVEVARTRLSRHGVEVFPTEGERLPFGDGAFDIVINSHAACRADELARVLEPGGVYWTQQFDSSSRVSVCSAFDCDVDPVMGMLDDRVALLKAVGLEIETARSAGIEYVYPDVATLVAHLSGMPWLVPGFTVDRDREHLERLQAEFELAGELRFARRVLLIGARKPKAG